MIEFDMKRLMSRAHDAVYHAIRGGILTRPDTCERCGRRPGVDSIGRPKIHAHHYRGYEPEYWLDVRWLCLSCHMRADKIDERLKARWREPESRAKMLSAIRAAQASPATAVKRSAVMRSQWSDAAWRARHMLRLARGDNHWSKQLDRTPSECTSCGQVCVGPSGLKQHITKRHRGEI